MRVHATAYDRIRPNAEEKRKEEKREEENRKEEKETPPPSSSSSSDPRARPREGDRDDDHDDDEPDDLQRFIEGIDFLNQRFEEILKYRDRLPDDVIRFGVDQALRYNGKSLKYVMRILDGYITNKLTTLDKVQRYERVRDQQTPRDDKSTRARLVLRMPDNCYANEDDFY